MKHNKIDTWFERSIFINWTCAIADCKYCYLSTVPKLKKDAVRSQESILAEIVICKAMGWDIGYITGGLRVESNDYLIDLMKKINIVLGEKIKMNFGPYGKPVIEKFKPYISGMGCAIESFDEKIHNFICPSKPLDSLLFTLQVLKDNNLHKFITIILGLGEKKEQIKDLIDNIRKYEINQIQFCFLKAQKDTIYSKVPAPNIDYMTWWIKEVRKEFPDIIIKVALVKERINEFHKLLEAGTTCFSRFMVFEDFNSEYAIQLEKECKKAGRNLLGNWTTLPKLDVKQLVDNLALEQELKDKIYPKAVQYYEKLKKNM